MAVVKHAKVYGFGSYFSNSAHANDIDLLIVHGSVQEPSCRFAIRCKRELVRMFPRAHVTILSETEEREAGFISTAAARLIATIKEPKTEKTSLKVDFVLD